MAPKSKDKRTRLQGELATDMAAFRAAMGMGTTEIGVIRDAVRSFIDTKLGADLELKTRFEEEKAAILAEKVEPIRLVKSDETNG